MLLLEELANNNTLLESLLETIQHKINHDEAEADLQLIIQNVVQEAEKLMNLESLNQQKSRVNVLIQTVNDITTAKLFTVNEKKRTRKKKNT